MTESVQNTAPLRIVPAEATMQPMLSLQFFSEYCRKSLSLIAGAWTWLKERRQAQLSSKRLRVCENVQLGEKRFVAIVQVDGQQFLIGGSATNLSLLGQLEPEPTFSRVLQSRNVMEGN